MTDTTTPLIETDAAIIGAGPVGLFQVFELGLLEIRAHVIDALPQIGGQPSELYPDKPIYDIPAIPVCSGQELTDALHKQIAPFAPTFHLGHEVSTLQKQADGRFLLESAQGLRLLAKAVFIAAGVGAFQPRRLTVPGIEAFENRQLFYRVQRPADFAGKHVVIAGGGNSALDWAIRFATQEADHRPASVLLLHRRDGFQATPASVAQMRALCEAQQMQFMVGQVVGFDASGDRLAAIEVMGPDGVTRRVPLDALLAFLGMSPKLGPIADWSLDIERKQLVVNTETYGTNEPGIFAVGDINTYPGKKKLILCGFHEATLAAYGALPFVFPGKEVPFQYTTTSTKLHKALGVSADGAAAK
ncbi:NAD(P)/FAD-dependent oxidoreductase [Ottowia sp. GY511]|uniref:Ferredoxin--NADP reductase n=1 Tax=Ottowia flava TaxID=2675430 RepID=A0ABW4KWX2_9BURK|nr:NAD(P)/FAD-dependent oxidoreductase [Ottowia sp. GY511]TXK33582.1 NAD(P)/FAD-dependent oxidoreductase [Ottowia sp. GY511]